jgi:RNA polymerase sigma-70 factor (ECF subfamily)
MTAALAPDTGTAADVTWALVERAQTGDPDAFAAIYTACHKRIYNYVRARVGGRQTTEDITAETFTRALRKIGTVRWQGRDICAWLYTIARNLVADHFKSARYHMELVTASPIEFDRPDCTPEGDPDALVAGYLVGLNLWAAVTHLSSEQRDCIVLRFLRGLSVAETAAVMGKNEGAVKALQYRACGALARNRNLVGAVQR